MKWSDTEYSGSPWEWRTLGVADPGSDGPWEWRTMRVVALGVVNPESGGPWEWRALGKVNPRSFRSWEWRTPGAAGRHPCILHCWFLHLGWTPIGNRPPA